MKEICEVVQDLLPLYHDGVCSEGSKKMVEGHLVYCEQCQEELRLMRETLDIKVEHKKPEEEKKVKAAAMAWKRGKRKSLLKGAISVLAVLFLFVGGYVGFRWQTTVQEDDVNGLIQLAETYFDDTQLSIIEMKDIEQHRMVLYKDNEGKLYSCFFETDAIFEERWRVKDGMANIEERKLLLWEFEEKNGERKVMLYVIYTAHESWKYETVSWITKKEGQEYEVYHRREIRGIVDVLDIYTLSEGQEIKYGKDIKIYIK